MLFGLVFMALALFHLTLALLLVWRPTPLVRRLGIWGRAAIVLLYRRTALLTEERTVGGPVPIGVVSPPRTSSRRHAWCMRRPTRAIRA